MKPAPYKLRLTEEEISFMRGGIDMMLRSLRAKQATAKQSPLTEKREHDFYVNRIDAYDALDAKLVRLLLDDKSQDAEKGSDENGEGEEEG